MGRKRRQELDYFPMDVYWDQDDKIKLIETEFGNQASSVYIKLISRIYREKGWWKKWDNDIEMLFARDVNENHGYIKEVVQGCLRRGLLNQSVFEAFGVLTSEAIQSRYIDIVNQLGRKDVVIVSEYWLLDKSFSTYSKIKPNVISISSGEKTITSERKDLNKNEKEIEKEIESESEKDAPAHKPDSLKDVITFFEKNGGDENMAEEFYYTYESQNWVRANGRAITSWQAAAALWIKNEIHNPPSWKSQQTPTRSELPFP